MLKLQCDRCKKLSDKSPELFGVDRHPMSQAGPPFGQYKLLPEWNKVLDLDLCPSCSTDVAFLVSCSPAKPGI